MAGFQKKPLPGIPAPPTKSGKRQGFLLNSPIPRPGTNIKSTACPEGVVFPLLCFGFLHFRYPWPGALFVVGWVHSQADVPHGVNVCSA